LKKETKTPDLPSLDDKCGAHFQFRDLIECGETFHILGPENIPQAAQTYLALRHLAEEILDPVVEKFGKIELTYGVSCQRLYRHIKGNISPTLDQHASYERNTKDRLICERGGAAVDFRSTRAGTRIVAQWIVRKREFDRLYYYGDQHPLHVSVGPEKCGQVVLMRPSELSGKRIPRRISNEDFLNMTDDSGMVIGLTGK
jgi:hypothetical protein